VCVCVCARARACTVKCGSVVSERMMEHKPLMREMFSMCQRHEKTKNYVNKLCVFHTVH
jgi:hypothetical protein